MTADLYKEDMLAHLHVFEGSPCSASLDVVAEGVGGNEHTASSQELPHSLLNERQVQWF